MPRIGSRSLVWAFAASLGLWAFLGQSQNAAAYSSYRGLWESRENDEGRIIQRNDQLLSFNFDQDLSDRLAIRENVSYGYQHEQEYGTREMVSPGASLAMNGDFFLANFAVNSVRNLNSQSFQPDTNTVGVNWTSRWQKKWVPDLRLNYDYSKSKLDSDVRKIDEGRKNYGGEVKWDLRAVQAAYSYRRDETTYTSYQTIQDSQIARINATNVWLDNRLRVSLGHEYSESRNQNQVFFDPTATTANIPVSLFSATTGIDNPPDDVNNEGFCVNPAPALLDSDLATLVYAVPVDLLGNNYSIRLQQNIPALAIDRLYLYTQDNLGPNPPGLQFRLLSNDDYTLTPWSEVVITTTYDPVNRRFVIDVPSINTRYLKLVVRNLGGPTLNFTEVKAEQIRHGAAGSNEVTVSKNKSNRSNFSLDFKLNTIVALYYNFLMARNDTDSKTMDENQNHNGGVRLQNASGDLRSNINYSLTKRRYLEGPEAQTQTYLVDINKVILPTLSVAVSGSHEETKQGGEAVSDRNRYTFYTDAKLYPDLTSRLEVIYWDQETYHPGKPSSLWDDLRTQLTVTSRFRPSLVVTFIDVYEIQNQDKLVFDKKNTSSLTGSWQLSEWFSVNGSVQKEDSQIKNTAYIYTLGMVVGLGAGLEFKINYSLQDSGLVSQAGSASLRWSSQQNVSWEVGCDYAETDAVAEQNIYKVYSKLLVSFSTQ